MKIRVLPRIFFEKVKGTPTEAELLAKSKIISINSSWGFDDTPPFSEELLNHPHLLTLTFDDICNEPETPEDLYNGADLEKGMAQGRAKRFVHGTDIQRDQKHRGADQAEIQPQLLVPKNAQHISEKQKIIAREVHAEEHHENARDGLHVGYTLYSFFL